MLTSFLTILYSLVAIIGAVGYLPQVVSLVKARTRSKSISISTWFIWLSSWLISLSYGVVVLGDMLFILVATTNIIGHVLIIGLTIWNRFFRFSRRRIVSSLVKSVLKSNEVIIEKHKNALMEWKLTKNI